MLLPILVQPLLLHQLLLVKRIELGELPGPPPWLGRGLGSETGPGSRHSLDSVLSGLEDIVKLFLDLHFKVRRLVVHKYQLHSL